MARLRSKVAIVAAMICLLVARLAIDEAKQRVDSTSSTDARPTSLVREPQGIYVSDPNDAWNQVFFLLFTRTVNARVIAPDSPVLFSGDPNVKVSEKRISRVEDGDRAIDPLYPSWLWMNSLDFDFDGKAAWKVLREPSYSRLITALEGVRLTARSRPPLARALMQADLWAAFDMVHAFTRLAPSGVEGPAPSEVEGPRPERSTDDVRERVQYARLLLPRLAMTMRALALSRDEIAALPNTYFASATALGLPNVLDTASSGRPGTPALSERSESNGWREVRWSPERSHDRAAHYRRANRVFLQLNERPRDETVFLNGLRDGHGLAPPSIRSAALLTQLLLVAGDGHVMPSSITSEVQLRGDAARHDVSIVPQFELRGDAARDGASIVPQYELSRRLLLASPAAGGLVHVAANAPAYLPSAGNDFGFATPPRVGGEPVEAPLERRCEACHGAAPGVGYLMTFSQPIGLPRAESRGPESPPTVERLPIADNVHGHDVARRKMEREDYRALLARW
jgi:hypothetical protein